MQAAGPMCCSQETSEIKLKLQTKFKRIILLASTRQEIIDVWQHANILCFEKCSPRQHHSVKDSHKNCT